MLHCAMAYKEASTPQEGKSSKKKPTVRDGYVDEINW
jgi:hypothetical protein